MSSILRDITDDAPFYEVRTSPYSENQVKYPDASPTTKFPLLITAIAVGYACK